MSYERYASLTGDGRSFLDRIGMAGLSDVDFDTSLPKDTPRPVDFS